MQTRRVVLLMPFFIVGCGEWPPVAKSRRDLLKMPANEFTIRVRGLEDDDIPYLKRFHNLRVLDFTSGYADKDAKITDNGLRELAKLDLPRLEHLSLGRCDKITDEGIAEVAKIKSLKILLLDGSVKITDAIIPHLNSAENLTELDLRGCPGITDQGVLAMGKTRKWKRIKLGGCPQVSDDAVKQLMQMLPGSKINKDDEAWRKHGYK